MSRRAKVTRDYSRSWRAWRPFELANLGSRRNGGDPRRLTCGRERRVLESRRYPPGDDDGGRGATSGLGEATQQVDRYVISGSARTNLSFTGVAGIFFGEAINRRRPGPSARDSWSLLAIVVDVILEFLVGEEASPGRRIYSLEILTRREVPPPVNFRWGKVKSLIWESFFY